MMVVPTETTSTPRPTSPLTCFVFNDPQRGISSFFGVARCITAHRYCLPWLLCDVPSDLLPVSASIDKHCDLLPTGVPAYVFASTSSSVLPAPKVPFADVF